ncbi:MAG TPA: WG repeat-containing protein [Burkholderiaceae bacterium]|nr:WG repeat-containing protein [Burkholderiaceae bacterium]
MGKATFAYSGKAFPDSRESVVPNACIHALVEGRAAVRLPGAMDDAGGKGDKSDKKTRGPGSNAKWGFLDRDGHLAIKPVFDAVSDFSHGLAAARKNGLWGYIDAQGKWVVAPAFTAAGPFSSSGLASIEKDGRFALIDRQGKVTGAVFGREVLDVAIGDGTPSLVGLRYRDRWLSPKGAIRYAPPGATLKQSLGSQGLFIAADASGNLGVVDEQGHWRVPARYRSMEESYLPHGLVHARGTGRGNDVLINERGGIVAGKGFRRIQALGKHFWLLEKDGRKAVLADAQGRVIQDLGAHRVIAIGPFAMVSLGDTTSQVFVPGQAAPLTISGSLMPDSGLRDGVLLWRDAGGQSWRYGGGAVAGILTRNGHWLTGLPWLASIQSTFPVGPYLVFRDRHDALLNIVNAEGKPMLSAETVKELDQVGVTFLPAASDASTQPVAIAILSACHCGTPKGAGLLLSDGTLLRNAAWQSIRSLDGEKDGEALNADDSPRSRQSPGGQRFVVQTATGLGMVDAAGHLLIPATQSHIGEFSDGLSLVFGNGRSYIANRTGSLAPAPNYFLVEAAGPGLLRFHDTAAGDAPWGLYDLKSGHVLVPPTLRALGDFRNGYAVARDARGNAGVLDLHGRWVVPARFKSLKPLGPRTWEANGSAYKSSIVTLDGKELVPPVPKLYTQVLPGGYVEASTNGNDGSGAAAWLMDGTGKVVAGGPGRHIRDMGNGWWRIHRDLQQAYVAADGQWVMAPSSVEGSPFHAPSGLALIQRGLDAHLIDAQGKAVVALPKGVWKWTAGSPWLRTFQPGLDGAPGRTDYADVHGKIVLSVQGLTGPFDDGYVLARLQDGRGFSWVDDKGKVVPMRPYQDLGLPSDGLAFASAKGLYGYVDRQNRYVIAPAFQAASAFNQGRAVVSTRHASMIIDKMGRPLARVTTRCGVRVLLDADNRMVWPAALPTDCGMRHGTASALTPER